VKPDNTVSQRPVTVGQQDDTQAVIAQGVQAGERVVTTGFAQLADGSRVTVASNEDGDRPSATSPRPGGNRRPNRPGAATGANAGAGRVDSATTPSTGAATSQPP
jgi:multidrug efflux system membrane fusion protein